MATLNVHEAMGMKVDREAVAGLVLPQLWMMSMGPCKSPTRRVAKRSSPCSTQRGSIQQVYEVSSSCPGRSVLTLFSVIKSLGARVEREHIEHLRAVRQAEAQTASLGMQNTGWELGHEAAEVDFETLVGRSSTSTPRVENGAASSMMDDWDNDMDWLKPKSDPVPVRLASQVQKSAEPD